MSKYIPLTSEDSPTSGAPLLGQDERSQDSHLYPEYDSSDGLSRNGGRQNRWLTWVCLIALFVTTLNLASLHVSQILRQISRSPLERANSYIGLDRLVRNASSPGYPLVRNIYPNFIEVVGSNAPVTSGQNASVLLDSVHSLVVSFESRDFGLESCALRLYVPHEGQRGHEEKTWKVEGNVDDIVSLSVWRSEVPTDASLAAMSSSRLASRRKEFLGTVPFPTPGRHNTASFYCPWRSKQTFEVACTSPGCGVEFVQNRIAPLLGFWMHQSEEPPNM
ncbi:hypothetical protein BV25DRAFT_1839990 [Artomyces pyxidatus]|uniref:Uncharacterized protein n=1 Tax=Artomyces pyxidatus TaxID=48021 RepID=A0ACB8SU86_9AGAM|nr:hypothetical protein BV25DRAFT_1839990 [Artomyces pyxidatus]